MKEFETVTEYEIIRYALYALIDRIHSEEEKHEKHKKEYGHPSEVYESMIEEHRKQFNELYRRFVEIEKNKYEENK